MAKGLAVKVVEASPAGYDDEAIYIDLVIKLGEAIYYKRVAIEKEAYRKGKG